MTGESPNLRNAALITKVGYVESRLHETPAIFAKKNGVAPFGFPYPSCSFYGGVGE